MKSIFISGNSVFTVALKVGMNYADTYINKSVYY